VTSVTGFVLAGGRSSRMGVDKALLGLGTENLLQRAVRSVAALCPDVIIVGDPVRYGGFGTTVADRVPGCGPLGGIHTALCITGSDRNLILSVDMPMMTTEFLRWLVDSSEDGDELATIPQVAGRTQPLCAVYGRGMLLVIEEAIAAGEYKVDRTFAKVPTRFLSEREINAAGYSADLFANVNTPEDFELLKRHSEEAGLPDADEARG
jgi:molybdopterin-guanine dinucleotide biosynthesis protein A